MRPAGAQVKHWRFSGTPTVVHVPVGKMGWKLQKGLLEYTNKNDDQGATIMKENFHYLRATSSYAQGAVIMCEDKPIVEIPLTAPEHRWEGIGRYLRNHPEIVEKIINLRPRLLGDETKANEPFERATSIVCINGVYWMLPNNSDCRIGLFHMSSYLNHSHSHVNCFRSTDVINGEMRVEVRASKPIVKGDMLTMDYSQAFVNGGCACPECNPRPNRSVEVRARLREVFRQGFKQLKKP